MRVAMAMMITVKHSMFSTLISPCTIPYTSVRCAPQESTPFVKPLQSIYPPSPCRFCRGQGAIACDSCGGRGFLGKGGYHTRNRVDLVRIIGSKWTAMETTFGWRHFEVISKQKGGNKNWFLELVATCDQNTRFWLNAQNLKDRERWSMGWLQKEDILRSQDKDSSGTSCKACKGMGRLPCVACEREGSKVDIIEI